MKLVFYKPKTIVGRLINLFTGARYSHVALLIDDIHIFDINWNHNAKIRHINTSSKHYDLYDLNLSIKQEIQLKEKIYSLIQSDYDLLNSFNIGNSIGRYNCYELIQILLYEVGYIDEIHELFLPEELLEVI